MIRKWARCAKGHFAITSGVGLPLGIYETVNRKQEGSLKCLWDISCILMTPTSVLKKTHKLYVFWPKGPILWPCSLTHFFIGAFQQRPVSFTGPSGRVADWRKALAKHTMLLKLRSSPVLTCSCVWWQDVSFKCMYIFWLPHCEWKAKAAPTWSFANSFFSKLYLPIYVLTLNIVCFKIYFYMFVYVCIYYTYMLDLLCIYLQMMCIYSMYFLYIQTVPVKYTSCDSAWPPVNVILLDWWPSLECLCLAIRIAAVLQWVAFEKWLWSEAS